MLGEQVSWSGNGMKARKAHERTDPRQLGWYYEDPITLRQDIENNLMEQIPVLSKMPSEITSDEQFVAILESFFHVHQG